MGICSGKRMNPFVLRYPVSHKSPAQPSLAGRESLRDSPVELDCGFHAADIPYANTHPDAELWRYK